MKASKKTLTMNEYLDTLLEIRLIIDNSLTEYIIEKTSFSGNEKLLNLETKIFSLWMISLAISDREIKDMFHQRFCNEVGFNTLQAQMFYDRIRICYGNYNYSFGCWAKDPGSGHVLGGVMTEILVNQNSEFSAEEKLPLVDGAVAMDMFLFFSTYFESTLDTIEKLREIYVFPVLN